MSEHSDTLAMRVSILTEHRNDHWFAKIENCPVAVYADSEKEAQQRAIEAFKLLLSHKANQETYLDTKGIPHWLESESMLIVTVPRGD